MPATPAAFTSSWNTTLDLSTDSEEDGRTMTDTYWYELIWYTNTYRSIELGLKTAAIVLGAINLVLGTMSWILVPRWRQFRNYVFLNIILSGTLLMATLLNVTYFLELLCQWCSEGDKIKYCFMLSALIYNNWTFVGSVMFYSEIVSVFERRIKRRYFLANVMGWLLPLGQIVGTDTVMRMYYTHLTEIITWLIYCVVNCIGILLYFRVLYVLVTSKSYSSCEICQKLVFSMLILFASSSSIGFFFLLSPMYVPILLSNLLNMFLFLNLIATNIFFVLFKSHRQLWAEQFVRWKINTIRT